MVRSGVGRRRGGGGGVEGDCDCKVWSTQPGGVFLNTIFLDRTVTHCSPRNSPNLNHTFIPLSPFNIFTSHLRNFLASQAQALG